MSLPVSVRTYNLVPAEVSVRGFAAGAILAATPPDDRCNLRATVEYFRQSLGPVDGLEATRYCEVFEAGVRAGFTAALRYRGGANV